MKVSSYNCRLWEKNKNISNCQGRETDKDTSVR